MKYGEHEMNSFSNTISLFALVALVGIGGCRGGVGNGSAGLTPEQQAAVDSVVEQIEAAARALASLTDGFDGIDADTDQVFGVCPVVSASFADGITNVTLDFPDGCVNAYFGNTPLSGGVSLTFEVASRAYDVTFNDLSTGERTVTGTLSLDLTRENLRLILVGDMNVSTTGVGTVVGTLSLRFDVNAGTITIVDGSLTLTDEDGVSQAVTVTDLLFRPRDNLNFIPEAGTITFQIADIGLGSGVQTVTITFDDQSPVDRTVDVTIGGTTTEYQLPSTG